MIAHLDRAGAIRLLEMVVIERGTSYRYVSQAGRLCVYVERNGVNPGCASCIVGKALAIHGVSVISMHKWDNAHYGFSEYHQPQDGNASFENIYRTFGLSEWMDEAAAVAFLAAQVAQDVGKTYGEVLYAAQIAPDTFDQWEDRQAKPSEQWNAYAA